MIRVAVVTVSDGVSAGTREDKSGEALAQRAAELGWSVDARLLLPDDEPRIADLLREWSSKTDLLLTTGGTGLGPRDRTPEAARSVAEREVPGFGELMRAEGRKQTKFADLSRSGAYTLGAALILTLPGSPKGAVQSLNAVSHLIEHAVDLLQGRTEHR